MESRTILICHVSAIFYLNPADRKMADRKMQTEKWQTEKWQTEKWQTEKWQTEKWQTEKWWQKELEKSAQQKSISQFVIGIDQKFMPSGDARCSFDFGNDGAIRAECGCLRHSPGEL